MDLLFLRDSAEPRRREVATWFLSSGIKPKVCIAFNSKLSLVAIMSQFKRPNILVSACTTELESLEAVEKYQPGLLICSDQLEEGDGLSLIVKAKKLVPTLKTCIVLDSIDSNVKLALQTKANAIVHEIDIGEPNFPLRQAFISICTGHFYLGPTAKNIVKALDGITVPRRLEDILTNREQSVLNGIIEGKTNEQISVELELSNHTINSYVKDIRRKAGVKSKTELVGLAMKQLVSRFNG
jgi:DNA-binding NarL/FixJ family response regulator